jgi:phosphotransferase family enzyme
VNVTWSYGAGAGGAPAMAPDPNVPQAARFEHGERPLAAAATALRLPGGLDDRDLLNVRYVPGRSLEVVHRAGGRTLEHAVRVRCVPRAALADELHRARAAAAGPARVAAVESWSAVATFAADDPELPGLRMLAAATPDAELVSYLPGRRAVVRVQGAGGARYAKLNAFSEAESREAVLRHLWELPGRGFAMARPLGADPALGAHWDAAVEGEPLAARLASTGPEAIIAGAVRALAALHAVPAWPDLGRFGAPDVLRRLEHKVLRRITSSLPSLTPHASELAAALRERLPDLPVGPPVVIHGDFHAANVLMVGHDVALLDLDDVALGDPEYDLALFGGRLLLIAMVAGHDIGAVERAIASLPDAYTAASGRAIDQAAFAWYLAATLVGRQVKTCVRCLPAGAATLGAELVERALAALRAQYAPVPARAAA